MGCSCCFLYDSKWLPLFHKNAIVFTDRTGAQPEKYLFSAAESLPAFA